MALFLATVGAAVTLFLYVRLASTDIFEMPFSGHVAPAYTLEACGGSIKDPINVVFSKAASPDLPAHFLHHADWEADSGSPQSFTIHGNCYVMDGQRASRQVGLTRYHSRYLQGRNAAGGVDFDPLYGSYALGDAHYERLDLCPGFEHAVPEGTPSGFDRGREDIIDNCTVIGPHTLVYRNWWWDNRAAIEQCNGWRPASDGNVAVIELGHPTPYMRRAPTPVNLWICTAPGCQVLPGEGRLDLEQWVHNVTSWDWDRDSRTDGLGRYGFTFNFSSSAFINVGIGDAGFLGSTGRAVSCAFTIISGGSFRLDCVSSGPPGDSALPGPLGDGVAARTWLSSQLSALSVPRPTKDNGRAYTVSDSGCTLREIFAHAIPGAGTGGAVACGQSAVTVRILEGDVNVDCGVDLLDEQSIAFRYGASFGLLLYNTWYDLEPLALDYDIDIKDLQFVFGRDGSTCQNPIPGQPPLL